MQRLILFAKRPRAGRVKTRLVPLLGSSAALGLYRAFLEDQIRFVASFSEDVDTELCLDGPSRQDSPLPVTQQGPGDLGQRMLRAFERSWSAGFRGTVIVGADSPTLPPDHVYRALRHLADGAALVLAPARDGGYVLIGLGRPCPALFREVPWGTDEVFEATLLAAGAAGLEPTILPPWYDVDDAAGLEALRSELATADTADIDRRVKATARYLETLPPPDRNRR